MTARGSGRCSFFALAHGAVIHISHSSFVVSMTDMAFGCMGSTSAFGLEMHKCCARRDAGL